MKNMLITGATGNVGKEVIIALNKLNHQLSIHAGVREISADQRKAAGQVKFLKFDFTDPTTYNRAFHGCDLLFLLRPPQISDVKKYFRPIVEACVTEKIKHIVFLSVQGVDNSRIIPHHKIENLIRTSGIPFTFLRPGYFMQNFTTTLRNDLLVKKQIFLPAGNAKFTLIDVSDIGSVAAAILSNVSLHINKSYELTCKEKLTFSDMAQCLSNQLGVKIEHISPNLIDFFLAKRKEKLPIMLILVMILLHYLPRFQKEPECTDWVEKITSKHPTTFVQFIKQNKNLLLGSEK